MQWRTNLLLKNDHIYSHTDLEHALEMAREAGHHAIVELLLSDPRVTAAETKSMEHLSIVA
jgi:hypothetical protein